MVLRTKKREGRNEGVVFLRPFLDGGDGARVLLTLFSTSGSHWGDDPSEQGTFRKGVTLFGLRELVLPQ